MTVPAIPKGLREKVYQRDAFRCGPCQKWWPEFCLSLQHIINRAGVERRLYWSPKNLITVCQRCHPFITDEHVDYQRWSASKFGDQDANLDAFWKALGRDWRIA